MSKDRPTKIKPRFISMAVLAQSHVIAMIFQNIPGSQDRLYDIMLRGAPGPNSGPCQGEHHPACTTKYGCVGQERLLLPGLFAVWLSEAQARLGIEIAAGDGEILVNKASLVQL